MIHPRGALLAASALVTAACAAGAGTVAVAPAAGVHVQATPSARPTGQATLAPSPVATPVVAGQATPSPSPVASGGSSNLLQLPGSGFAPPPPPTASGVVSDAGIAFNGASVLIEATDAKGAVAGAHIAIYGPTLGAAVANESGKGRIGPLANGTSYRVVVRAPGHVPGTLTGLKLAKGDSLSYTVKLEAGTSVSGRVTNGSYAVVSVGDNSTIADAQGAFTLDGLSPTAGAQPLTVSRPHYALKTLTITPTTAPMTLPDITLTPAPASAFLSFDGLPAASFSGLPARLSQLGWQLATAPVDGGLWVVVAPKTPPDAATLARMAGFAHAGGKLVIVGEWGGYASYQPLAANAIAHEVGLHLNPDLIRDPGDHPEWLTVHTWGPAGGVAHCYSAASTFGLAPMAAIAASNATGYRVQAFGGSATQAIATGGPWGAGKAVVVGDASLWSDSDTDGNGTPNLQEGDNAAFWDQIAEW